MKRKCVYVVLINYRKNKAQTRKIGTNSFCTDSEPQIQLYLQPFILYVLKKKTRKWFSLEQRSNHTQFMFYVRGLLPGLFVLLMVLMSFICAISVKFSFKDYNRIYKYGQVSPVQYAQNLHSVCVTWP